MDPWLSEALRFLVAILSGGFVAVVAQQIAFRRARQLQQEEHARARLARRAALSAELRENLTRLEGVLHDQIPGASIVRVAWDAARGEILEASAFEAIAAAYASGAELERYADFIVGRVVHGGVAAKWLPESRAREKVLGLARQRARATHAAFLTAVESLDERETHAQGNPAGRDRRPDQRLLG